MRINQLVPLLLIISFLNVVVIDLNISPAKASHQGDGSDALVAYVTEAVISPGQSIEVMVGMVDSGGNFLTGHSLSVEHVASSTMIQTTSTLELQSVSLDIPISTPEGIQELLVQSGNLSLTINFWTDTSLEEGTIPTSFSVTSFPEVNVGELFNGSAYYEPVGQIFTILSGNELLITSLPWNNTDLILNIQQIGTGLYSPGVTLDFQASIPLWLQSTEIYALEIVVRNSTQYQDAFVSQNFSIIEPPWTYNLSFPGNDTSLNRLSFGEQANKIINLSLQGISLTNLEIEASISTFDNNQIILVSRNSVSQSLVDIPFFAPFGTTLGNATLEIKFYRQNQIVQTIQQEIFIYDLIDARITLDPPFLEAGASLDIEIFTFEEDTVLPLPANVTIIDSRTGEIILSENTPATGRIIQTIVLSENITTGTRDWYITTEPIGISQVYVGQTTTLEQNIFGNTEIQLIDPPLQVVRGDEVLLKAVLASEGQPVSEGSLYLKDLDDNILETFEPNVTAEYQISITDNQTLGRNSFVWEYSGSTNFQTTSLTQSIIVLSRPHFDSVEINTTQVAPNDWVTISGSLFDENNTPVTLAVVELWKISSTEEAYIQDLTVDVDGNFTHEFQITSNDAIGIHAFELRFLGDPGRYYLSADRSPRIEISRNLALDLLIDTDESGYLYGNQFTTVHVQGRISGHYIVEYNTNNPDEWFTLVELNLNETGQGSSDVFLPEYYGLITFRTRDTLTNDSIIVNTTLYIKPDYSIEVVDPATTSTLTTIRTFSAMEYRVYIDEFAISPIGTTSIDTAEWNYTFIEPGVHKIRLNFENEFAPVPFIEEEVYIAQGLLLDITAPEILTEGIQATINLKLTTPERVPLQGMEISLERRYSPYMANQNNNPTSELLAKGITELDGSLTLYSQIIGDQDSLFFKIKANSDLDIVDTEFEFPFQVLRQLETDLDQKEIKTFENTPLDVNFQFKYKYVPDEIPSNILVNIVLKKGNEIIEEFSVSSNNQGIVNFRIQENLASGTYVLEISVTDSAFSPFIITRTLVIEQADPLQTIQNSDGILALVATLGFLGILTFSLRRYTRS
jgi:hypothetical protein